MEPTDEKICKIVSCNNIKPACEGRCGFFVKRKQRYCKMIPAKGNRYCAEHLCEDKDQSFSDRRTRWHWSSRDIKNFKEESQKRKRINCPLDPKHTVFEDKLSKHLKKCNATLKTQLPYYTADINLGRKDCMYTDEEQAPLYHVPVQDLKDLIYKVKRCHDSIPSPTVRESFTLHPVLDEELKIPTNGPSVRKHLIQQASLVHILTEVGTFRDDIIIMEFGAGRGALSHWVQKAMKDKLNSKFLLIDRQHNRNKLDCYHKGDDQGPNFERLNIDIQHLNMGNVLSLTNNDLDIAAIGKHLCGGATDLSLRCLLEAEKSEPDLEHQSKRQKKISLISRVHSILFALCCYHRCTWSTYIGTEFFLSNNFSATEFNRIAKMAGWATCGFERRNTNTKQLKNKGSSMEEHDKPSEEQEGKTHLSLGLTSREQEEIGRMCKRIIDFGRLDYIHKKEFDGELVVYVKSDITPENVALIVKRREDIS